MAKKSLRQDSLSTIESAFDKIISGKSDLHLVESGVSVFIDQNRATAVKPKVRGIVATNPTASILIKKKAFSTFKATNDLRWMDKTEKMLLRATKALFALKVAQIRAYESLTKLDKFYEETGDFNFALLADLIASSKYLQLPSQSTSNQALSLLASFGSAAGIASSLDDVIKILRRNAFSTANTKTTWIVDPDDVTNYGTGPGTGVIELCTFTNINTNVGVSSDAKSASFSILDPYRIMNIIEDDIEMAIEESLVGTLGLFNDLAYSGIGGEYIDPVLIVSSAFELGGLGRLDSTIDVDYIRDRLRTFYLGKWIVNVNDGVHIFMASNKSVFSNNPVGGDTFDSENHQESHGFDSDYDSSYSGIDETILEAERKLYTNQNISSDTYKKIRKYSNNSFIMQHVFGGYIKSVSESYSPDKTTISVSCVDNMGWLASVRFMEEPALMDPKAPLEDPLTPYDFKTISSSDTWKRQDLELLPENKILLKSGLLSFDSGLLNGYNANETNIFQGQYSQPGSMNGAQVVQHPSGMIYRWRTGVLALTSQFNPAGDPMSQVPASTYSVSRQNYGFSVANSVVSNLDVANVISVMVTGQPYNSETFTQQAVDAMNGSRSGNSFRPSEALSFVLDSIRKQNPFYGNFKPFRTITVSEQTINRLSGDAFTNEENRSKVTILRRRKNELLKKIRTLSPDQATATGNAQIIGLLKSEILTIDSTINNIVRATYENYSVSNSGGINASDLLNTNFNIFGSNKILKTNGNLESNHDLTRAMMRVATTRRIEDVKLNRDQNLLIVSDQYDINPDIKAFILNLKTSGFKLFQGNYLNVYDRCTEAAKVTMMEFFCNSQGHLEIRPPQYNKTPLSVLNALYSYQNTTNKKIVPDFLFKMFEQRISSLKLEIHYLNVRIAILAMMLGRYPDSRLIPGVTYTGEKSLEFFGVSGGELDPKSIFPGNILSNFSIDLGTKKLQDTHNINFRLKLGSKEDGDILEGDTKTQIGNFDEIVREFRVAGSTETIYDVTLNSILSTDSLTNPNKEIANSSPAATLTGTGAEKIVAGLGNSTSIANTINTLIQTFRSEAGHNPGEGLNSNGDKFEPKDILIDPSYNNFDKIQSRLDYIFGEISKAISRRNSLINILNKNIEREAELQNIEENLLSGFGRSGGSGLSNDPNAQGIIDRVSELEKESGNKYLGGYQNFVSGVYEATRKTKNLVNATKQFLTGSANQGTLFDHLIDDDTRNLSGPGSGRRFIIYDEQIKSYDVKERDPEVTRIDIFGSTPLINEQIKRTTGGENFIQWAGAVDYDLWRQYGYKHKPINDAPFISDAETQAKPLALQHLALQRAIIFSGSIQVVGNEYYQPGDTVYIPSKGLLFYVNSVTHSFNFGSSFDTNLDLIFGHAPGTYLPTPVDIIGQSYSKDTLKQGNYFVKRTDYGDNNYRPLLPDCSIRFPTTPEITESNLEYLLSHRNNMVKFYNMVTDISNGLLSPSRVLLIRGFLKNKEEKDEIFRKMNIISYLFQNPVMLSQTANTSLGDDLLADSLGIGQIFNANITSGLNKTLKTLTLPNGVPVTKVQKSQILLQLVNLNKENSESSFNCFSPSALRSSFSLINGASGQSIKDFDSLTNSLYSDLPKAGPSQSTWLEMDDLISNLFNSNYEKVIEIGVLNLDTSKVKLLMSLK